MILQWTDFNSADELFEKSREWREIADVLSSMPLHLKASDQRGKKGSPIFDPVGTNQAIKEGLVELGWDVNISIPGEYNFLGTDVDYAKNGILGEAQFSNYPFLLNNTLRSELFFKADVEFSGAPVRGTVIITKAKMFPASNSTLYYEQGRDQLKALAEHEVFDVPIRLVGLFSLMERVEAVWTEYDNPRYSRTVEGRVALECVITPGASARSRSTIDLV